MIQSTEEPAVLAALSDVWVGRIADERLRGVLEADPAAAHDAILRALGEASRAFRPIEASLRRPKPAYVVLGPGGAWLFLSEAAPLLRAAGHAVAIPPEFGSEGSRRLRARLHVAGTGRGAWRTRAPGEDGTGLPSWDTPAEFRWEVAVGNDPITSAEFRALARGKRPLLHWRGKWVLVDPADLATIARLVSQRATGAGNLAEALALALRGGVAPAPGLAEAPVVAGGALGDLVQALRSGGFGSEEEPPGFRGKLRPYQKRGVAWLHGMSGIGLGTLLADDMGLGKTIQVLAFLLRQRSEKPDEKRGSLLVCPTSVLGNWQREAERFAPPLPVVRQHGPGRPKEPEALEKWVPPGGLVLTTYATARGDAELLCSYEWAHVILDEAQNVKNPATAQARAVRRFRAPSRIALTGTPVENRLQDLWMLLQFANPGFLGPLAEFRQAFAKPIERYRDPEAAARLRRLTGPFVLRRLKSEVEADLPEKIEGTVACSLTREQATLYKQALERQWGGISGASGMERRGRVLALLTHLKQICNHPAHFMKEAGEIRGRSGKLQRLTEMLEEAISTGDRSLIFTQYVEMGDLLAPYLAETFKIEAPFLHGSLTGPARDALVKRFQEDPNGPPVLLVSLRAGGTGLNLTRATHVFHFDRWWNPAVEDQATDRTHRIGQTRAVHVHKLVTIGTLEEKISEMLEKKRGLADAVVGTGEGWLTELDDDQLRELVELSGDVVVGAEES
ncbi:MAG: DEAD/DEAH box helicase [Planctomycetales bacterium]|nr:DEAD/DEAH box helicase [Planctomycetales bacterium]